jgi:hypothetical protein
MIVCPVCEHAQAQGAECDLCGKGLAPGPAAVAAVPRIDGLEPTSLADGSFVAASPIAELEPTGHAAVAVLDELTPGIEPTRAPPVDVEVTPTPGIERTAAEATGDARTEVPLFVTCRYCRSPSMPGERVCGRCGMRLPSFGGTGREAAQEVRRCGCGAPVTGSLCPSCGARAS